MTEANETKTVDPADEAAKEPETSAIENEPTSFWKRVADDFKEAGEQGKKQWEEAIAKTRELLLGAKAEDEGEPEKEGAVDRLKKKTVDFAKAQGRGAELLLSLVTRARKSLEALEGTLEEARAEAAAEAAEPVEGTPVIA